jgi:hypothetical protein
VTAPAEFGPALDRLYGLLLDCLPAGVRPSDCRVRRSGCPAVMSCQPVNGFMTPDGGCADGLHFVTRNLERISPVDVAATNCFVEWGLRVDVYLFPPCKKPSGDCWSEGGFGPGAMWALTCCLHSLNPSLAWSPTGQVRCADRVVLDPTVVCVQEGVCKGSRTSFLLPVP